MNKWQKQADKYFMHTGERLPVTLVKGKGGRVWDDGGRCYLDFVGGWAVNNLGHCPDMVVDAVKEQVGMLMQTSNHFYTIPQIQLAELLVKNSCLDQVFLCNSGAEANEAAVKLARRYGKLKLNGAYEVITATGSFHGRTLSMVSASGQQKYQKPYTPLPSGYVNIEYNRIEAIKKATCEKTCAVMLEPIQGEGGVNVADESYLKAVRQWCTEKEILLILDEIQTGIGRTGTLFAYQQYGIEPDIMSLAKGLGSGLPIGAILAKERVSVFGSGEHGSTFGGNPVTCSAAYAALKYLIDTSTANNASKMGGYCLKGLADLKQEYSFVTDIRGKGLLIAVEFDRDIAKDLQLVCLEKGLLVNAVKPNALRFMPPLIINSDDVDEAIAILKEALAQIQA
jgi:predicted acetylornithine/succinylornithine family transaminase